MASLSSRAENFAECDRLPNRTLARISGYIPPAGIALPRKTATGRLAGSVDQTVGESE